MAFFACALICWALFWDRSRGRRRCPKCWYDMAGVPGLKCPECGREAKGERALRRTRRRWRWAGLGAVLGLIGIGGACVPKYQQGGWTALVPSAGLAICAPIDEPRVQGASVAQFFTPSSSLVTLPTPTMAQELCEEIWRRFHAGSLGAWEERVVIRRYLAVCLPACPLAVTAPGRWPAGTPMPVMIDPLPLDRLYGGTTMVSLQCGPGPMNWLGQTSRESSRACWALNAMEAATSLVFEVSVHTDKAVERGAFSLPVNIGGTTATFLERVDSAEASGAVREALSPRLADGGEQGLKLVFGDRAHAGAWGGLDCEVAYQFEIMLDGKVLGRGHGEAALEPVWKDWETAPVEWAEGGAGAAASGRTEITVRADPEAGGRLYMTHPFDRDRAACWAGEFRMPLIVREKPK